FALPAPRRASVQGLRFLVFAARFSRQLLFATLLLSWPLPSVRSCYRLRPIDNGPQDLPAPSSRKSREALSPAQTFPHPHTPSLAPEARWGNSARALLLWRNDRWLRPTVPPRAPIRLSNTLRPRSLGRSPAPPPILFWPFRQRPVQGPVWKDKGEPYGSGSLEHLETVAGSFRTPCPRRPTCPAAPAPRHSFRRLDR